MREFSGWRNKCEVGEIIPWFGEIKGEVGEIQRQFGEINDKIGEIPVSFWKKNRFWRNKP
ncbi:hypothetical protein [Neobacillus vireti]|uniref:hypothetical protein n=1 Tax=Neobacillus vireti TaxID=220686 RepID=UPI0004196A93|nr:hypothetical protein [Neobacillus vireti]KLT16886.1 hypothetical protein AA980_13330 [Neobacillus vireti]